MLNDNVSLINNFRHEMYLLVLSSKAKQPELKKGERNCFYMENGFFCDV